MTGKNIKSYRNKFHVLSAGCSFCGQKASPVDVICEGLGRKKWQFLKKIIKFFGQKNLNN
jgi:hypothetical protein